MTSAVAKLNKFQDEETFKTIIKILMDYTKDEEEDDVEERLVAFAKTQGISNVNILRTLLRDLESIPRNAVKKNLTPEQLKADLADDGLQEDLAALFVKVYQHSLPDLRAAALKASLAVNELVDVQWKFGVTAASSDVQSVGNTFLQMKWTIKGAVDGALETMCMELSLPQFYKFLHEMEKAKASMDVIG